MTEPLEQAARVLCAFQNHPCSRACSSCLRLVRAIADAWDRAAVAEPKAEAESTG